MMRPAPSEVVAVIVSGRAAHTPLSSDSPGAPGGLAPVSRPVRVEGRGVVSPLHARPHACPGHGFGGQPPEDGAKAVCVFG